MFLCPFMWLLLLRAPASKINTKVWSALRLSAGGPGKDKSITLSSNMSAGPLLSIANIRIVLG